MHPNVYCQFWCPFIVVRKPLWAASRGSLPVHLWCLPPTSAQQSSSPGLCLWLTMTSLIWHSWNWHLIFCPMRPSMKHSCRLCSFLSWPSFAFSKPQFPSTMRHSAIPSLSISLRWNCSVAWAISLGTRRSIGFEYLLSWRFCCSRQTLQRHLLVCHFLVWCKMRWTLLATCSLAYSCFGCSCEEWGHSNSCWLRWRPGEVTLCRSIDCSFASLSISDSPTS